MNDLIQPLLLSVFRGAVEHIEWDKGLGGVQLYRYQTDPEERHNLVGKPMQAERTARMKLRLAVLLNSVAVPNEFTP